MNRSEFIANFLKLLEKELPEDLPEKADENFYLKAVRLYVLKRLGHIVDASGQPKERKWQK